MDWRCQCRIIANDSNRCCVCDDIGCKYALFIMTIIAAVLYIPLATLVCSYKNNLNYLLYVMCAVNLPGLLVNIVQYYKIVNRRAKGIWLK